MIAELTGMDLANSSMYDGGTSLAEAGMLAAGHTRRKKSLFLKQFIRNIEMLLQRMLMDNQLKLSKYRQKMAPQTLRL